jgi:PPOX class probable F420-dependent enzyme
MTTTPSPKITPGVNQRASITMSPDEADAFLQGRHTMSLASLGADGRIHMVAMWYGFVDGRVVIETKEKSQKAVNLRRDPNFTAMVDAGDHYHELQGVEWTGRAEPITDRDTLWQVGVSVFSRYFAPVTPENEPAVERMLNKRIGFFLDADHTVSWDHRKLNLG